MITETLLGFACLIANGDSNADPTVIEARKVVSTFSDTELAEAQSLVRSGACLPPSFENLLEETRVKVEKGEILAHSGPGGPSESCF